MTASAAQMPPFSAAQIEQLKKQYQSGKGGSSAAGVSTSGPGSEAQGEADVLKAQEQLRAREEEHSPIEKAINRRLYSSDWQGAAVVLPKECTDGSSISANNYSTLPTGIDCNQYDGQLKQFGYSLFSNDYSSFSPPNDIPIPPEYVLGPGDELQVQYYGSRSDTLSLTIDRNGVANVPDVGPVTLAGKTYNEARATLAGYVGKRLTGVTASINMGRLRSIRVFVLGDVRNPGSFLVSSLSTISNALFISGGPSKNGSMRHVQLKRGGKNVVEIDLYDFLLKGDGSNDKRLMPGDVIFVPPIGEVVAVAGEVTRPAIYELSAERGIKELLDLAGRRMHTADQARLVLDRLEKNGERHTIDIDMAQLDGKLALQGGDMLIFNPLPENMEQYVQLSGAVKRPGRYGIQPGMKLIELIPSSQALLEQSYLARVEITHRTIVNGEQRVTSRTEVSLEGLFAGSEADNIVLQPYDLVLVRTIADWGDAEWVRLSGEVMFPGTYTLMKGEKLSSLIRRAGGFSDSAYLPALMLTRETIRQQQVEEQKRLTQQIEQGVIDMEAQAINMMDKELMAAKQRSLAEAKRALRDLQGIKPKGRLVLEIPRDGKIDASAADIELKNGDTVHVPSMPSEVIVMGQVYNSVAMSYNKDNDKDDYVEMAGGVTDFADEGNTYIVRASGIVVSGKKAGSVPIEPGDVIVVPENLDRLHLLDSVLAWSRVMMQVGMGVASMKTLGLIK